MLIPKQLITVLKGGEFVTAIIIGTTSVSGSNCCLLSGRGSVVIEEKRQGMVQTDNRSVYKADCYVNTRSRAFARMDDFSKEYQISTRKQFDSRVVPSWL